MNFYRLISLLMTTLLAVAEPNLAAQGSPCLSTVIQDANKEGKLKLMWGEGTLGGTKGAAKFETMINKMFGTNIKIGFTPGAAMPQMGSQIAAEYAAGQSAASDVYIGADSYLAPLVKHKLFHEVDWAKLLPGRITNEMVEGGRTSSRGSRPASFSPLSWIVPAPRLLRPKLTARPWNTLSRSMGRCSAIAC